MRTAIQRQSVSGCCRHRAQPWKSLRRKLALALEPCSVGMTMRSPGPPAGGPGLRARLDGVITTAAINEVGKSAWCREQGVYPAELAKWQMSAIAVLGERAEARASPQATRHNKKRIKELERDLLRKDRALAETAALLVLAKKVAVIFNRGEAE